jgi:hypothetical protein
MSNKAKVLQINGAPYHTTRANAKRLVRARLAKVISDKPFVVCMLPAIQTMRHALVPENSKVYADELLDELGQPRHRRRGSHIVPVHRSTVNKKYVECELVLEEERRKRRERRRKSRKSS